MAAERTIEAIDTRVKAAEMLMTQWGAEFKQVGESVAKLVKRVEDAETGMAIMASDIGIFKNTIDHE